jgi:hypothetical protein
MAAPVVQVRVAAPAGIPKITANALKRQALDTYDTPGTTPVLSYKTHPEGKELSPSGVTSCRRLTRDSMAYCRREAAVKEIQVSLPDDTFDDLHVEAKKAGVPAALIVREAVEAWLHTSRQQERQRALFEHATAELGPAKLDEMTGLRQESK